MNQSAAGGSGQVFSRDIKELNISSELPIWTPQDTSAIRNKLHRTLKNNQAGAVLANGGL